MYERFHTDMIISERFHWQKRYHKFMKDFTGKKIS